VPGSLSNPWGSPEIPSLKTESQEFVPTCFTEKCVNIEAVSPGVAGEAQMPMLCRGVAEVPEEQFAWPCPARHFAPCASLLPSVCLWEAAPRSGSQRLPAQQGWRGAGAEDGIAFPLRGSCLGLCNLMLLCGKTAAVPCCVGLWDPCPPWASQLAVTPLLDAWDCEELPLSLTQGPSLHLLMQCAGPCPSKATHQRAPSALRALGG